MIKILKNITNEDIFINDTGVNLLANSSFTIVSAEHALWADSLDIRPFINNGFVVVNDGLIDLNITEALAFITESGALGIRFSDSSFTATNVREAIIEAKATASGGSGNEEHGRNIVDSDYIIKNNRQMLLFQECEIINEFTLNIEGELVILE